MKNKTEIQHRKLALRNLRRLHARQRLQAWLTNPFSLPRLIREQRDHEGNNVKTIGLLITNR